MLFPAIPPFSIIRSLSEAFAIVLFFLILLFCLFLSFPRDSFSFYHSLFYIPSQKNKNGLQRVIPLAGAYNDRNFFLSTFEFSSNATSEHSKSISHTPNPLYSTAAGNHSTTTFDNRKISAIMGNASSAGVIPMTSFTLDAVGLGDLFRSKEETKGETILSKDESTYKMITESETTRSGIVQGEEKAHTHGEFGASKMLSKNSSVDPEELVFQTWAYCKAKPSPPSVYTYEKEIEKRKEALLFRERPSFTNLDCGEDSFFVARHNKAMGVADGVGGWRKSGVDPSAFSNALMAHAKAYTDQHEKELDPQKIMDAAHKKVLKEKKVKAGSSTACIATLKQNKDGSHELDVANLGDSGLLVVRDRKYVFRAREQQHSFNAPYQLAVVPPSKAGRSIDDTAKDAAREKVKVQEGDVILMGTDGLFDNCFPEHLAEDAGWIGWLPSNYSWGAGSNPGGQNHTDHPYHNSNAFLAHIPLVGRWLGVSGIGNESLGVTDPFRVAQRLVMNASKTSLDRSSITPWSMAYRRRGRDHYTGGKPDDITVILGRIGKRGENNSNVPVW